jgi:cytochrome P450
MTLELPVSQIDLSDPAPFEQNRVHELFAILRREAPVHRNPENESIAPFWSITKYEDVMSISRQPELFSSVQGITQMARNIDPNDAGYAVQGRMLITMDPPRHVRLRRLVNKGFTPRAVAMWEPHIREITNELLDGLRGKNSADFVTEVSANLPLAVICQMMGVPRDDWNLMFRLTNKILGAGDIEYQDDLPPGMEPGTGDAARYTGSMGLMTMLQYFGKDLAERRAGKFNDDLVNIIMNSEIDGEKLTDEEILFFCFLLIVAGNETTRNGISGGVLALSDHPEEKAKLMASPALINGAVEEILRWVSPVTHMARVANRDTEIRGQQIQAGERVVMWYPSVNRDEDIFPDGHIFNIERTPNDHLAFGIGEHFCLGAGFARLEIKVMVEELLKRFPEMQVTGIERLRSTFIGGIKHLTVSY